MWRLIKRRNTRVADENMHIHVQQPGDQDAAGPGQSGIGRLASTVGALLALILHWVDNSTTTTGSGAAAAGVHMEHEWQRLQSHEVNAIIVQDSMRYAIYV